MKLRLLVLFAACFIAGQMFSLEARSQTCSDIPKEIQDSCAHFFTNIKNNRVQEAYKCLLNNSAVAKSKEQFNNLVEQTARASELYGAMSDFECVNSERVCPSLIRVRYITKHVSFPMRWIITYYNSPTFGWIVMTMKFDDSSEYFFAD